MTVIYRIVLLMLLVLATGVVHGLAQPEDVCPAGKLAFASNRDGNWEIYAVDLNFDAEGSVLFGDPVRLTDHRAHDRFPAWSPDGKYITFYSERDGTQDIYVMDADGSNPRRLTSHRSNDLMPAWSPDGTQIVFSSERNGASDIYAIHVDGSDERRLTDDPNDDLMPKWSPDGQHIVFYSDRSGKVRDSGGEMGDNWELYVMNADGSNVVRLTEDNGIDALPAWSPDGKYIAFTSTRDGGEAVYVMEVLVSADGEVSAGEIRLVSPTVGAHPAWSPDGQYIAYVFDGDDPDGYADIYLTAVEGEYQDKQAQRMVNIGAHDWLPSWTSGESVDCP